MAIEVFDVGLEKLKEIEKEGTVIPVIEGELEVVVDTIHGEAYIIKEWDDSFRVVRMDTVPEDVVKIGNKEVALDDKNL